MAPELRRPRAICIFLLLCRVLLSASQDISKAKFNRLKKVCVREPESKFPPARIPNDLKTILGPVARGEVFAEYKPRVLSEDPWIIVFDRFLSEEEMEDIDETLFWQKEPEFEASSADRSGSSARKSESAFCIGDCAGSRASQLVEKRASTVVRAPTDNIDFIQAVRYKPGMFYREHHDNRDSFGLLPCGARTFTFFVYLSNVTDGGGTRFPRLGIEVPARRGAAVLFSNTLDSDPSTSDDRTHHEAVTVGTGLKRGLNVWIYNYNYKHFWANECTSIMYADMLAGQVAPSDSESDAGAGEGDAAGSVELEFYSQLDEESKVFWVDTNQKGRPEIEMLTLSPEHSSTLKSYPGHLFHVRSARTGKGLKRYEVKQSGGRQTVVIKPRKRKQEL